MSPSSVRYDDAIEVVQPDEDATLGAVVATFHDLQTIDQATKPVEDAFSPWHTLLA